jgi:hypothetical protein
VSDNTAVFLMATLAAVFIIVLTLGIIGLHKINEGHPIPPCQRSGIATIDPRAHSANAGTTGILIVCRDGRSYWP